MPIASNALRLSLAVLVFALCAPAPCAAAEGPACSWPQFHGPQRDNVSTETGLLKRWPDDGPKLLWTAKGLGQGFTTVSIAGGLIYTAGNIDGKTVISALDLDGALKWQAANGGAWTGSQPGSRGVPTIEEGRLFHESPLGDVVCLEAATGKRLWGLNILEEFGSRNITWALSESLLIDGPRLICCPGGPQTAVVALDKTTGKTAWKSPSAGDLAGYASPSLGEHQGLRMIFTLTSKALVGLSARDGGLLFRFPHETPYDEMVLMPIYRDGRVFISTRTAGAVMLKLSVSGTDAKKVFAEPIWRSKDLDNHHGGVVLLDGFLYGSGLENGGRWACLDWETGKTMHLERGVGKGSVTCAEGMLYTFSEKGLLGLVKATPAAHELISRFRIPPQGEGPCWSHPVVCGGRLYVRHGEYLYCYDVRAR